MCIAAMELCHSTGGSYICLLSESNGPNLLDEPLKGFIVTPACSPWKCFGSCKAGDMGITTHSKSIQSLHECKTGISAVLTVTSGLGTFTEWMIING